MTRTTRLALLVPMLLGAVSLSAGATEVRRSSTPAAEAQPLHIESVVVTASAPADTSYGLLREVRLPSDSLSLSSSVEAASLLRSGSPSTPPSSPTLPLSFAFAGLAAGKASRKSSGVKENEQNPDAIGTVRIDAPNPQLPEVDEDLERRKARGQTESQLQERAYYEGRFQTHEPTADKKRDKGDSVRQDAEQE